MSLLCCLFASILFVGVNTLSLECNPSYYPYVIEVTYKEEASSQSIEVFQIRNDSSPFVTSIYGYGKDFLMESTLLCVNNNLYRFTCSSTNSKPWSEGSFFEVKAFGRTTVMRGTVDVGSLATYYINPFNPIEPGSAWRWSDFYQESWESPSFDDSDWSASSAGSFYPLGHHRFYRFSTTLPSKVLTRFSSFELYVKHICSIRVFINGIAFLEQLTTNDTAVIETNKREGIYSFIRSPRLTVAIEVFRGEVRNLTADPFTSHMVFLSFSTPPSSLLSADSSHKKDFYAHPLASLIDGDRKTAWWFYGACADVTFTFSNPLSARRCSVTRSGEFVNMYSIVASTEKPKSDPRRWELYGSNNNRDFVLIDARSNETFAYRLQTRRFFLNNTPKNYRFFLLRILENGGGDITTLGLFSLVSTRTILYDSLHYRPNYRFSSFDVIHITPLSSGFSHFSLHGTSLPPSLSLDPTSGTIHGGVFYPTSFNVTVIAENMVDHAQSVASFFVEVVGCDGNHTILQVERSNQLYSSIEMLNITTSQETVISRGYDSLAGESSEVSYYCIPKEVVNLVSYIASDALLTQRERRYNLPGSFILRIPYPIYSPSETASITADHAASMTANHPALIAPYGMSFYAIASMSIEERGQSLSVSPFFVVAADTTWRFAADCAIGRDWFRRDYDDSAWSTYTPPAPIYKRRDAAFRTWFDVSDAANVTGVEVKVKHTGHVIVMLNEVLCLDVRLSSEKTWTTITLPADRVKDGPNLIAVFISPNSHPHDSPHDSPYVTNDFFLHCVVRLIRETEFAARAIDTRVSASYVSPFLPSNLLSDSFATSWLAEFSNREVTVSFAFQYNSQHFFNKYCVTNGAESSDLDPSTWTLHVNTDRKEQRLTLVDSQGFVPWSGRLQTQCFLLPTSYDGIVSVFWKVSGRRGQTRVQATRIAFFSVNVATAVKDPFTYGVTEIEAFLNMPIYTQCPSYPRFAHFSIRPDLPRGLVLNQGTGCLSGTLQAPFRSSVFTISARNLANRPVSVTLRIVFKQCVYPNTALSIPLQTAASAFSVEVLLFSATWSIIRSSILFLSDSQQVFFHCLPPDVFFLLLADHSAQGDLASSFSIQQNARILQQGVFNPGFPQEWSSLITYNSVSTNHTLWYYSVAGKQPPANWFAQITPPTETWPTGLLTALPPLEGVAHYFKTVLELPSLPSIHTLALFLRLRAGVAVFINGQEVVRFNLPSGPLRASTLAVRAFPAPTTYTVFLPVQFSSLQPGRNVLAVETHLARTPAQPTDPYLQADVQFLSQHSQALVNAEVVDLSAVRGEMGSFNVRGEMGDDVSLLHDGIYYNHYFRHSDCKNQSIAFFSANGQPDFASSFTFYTGPGKGAYPHRMTLFGRFLGSLEEIERAKKGDPVSEREWMKLCEQDDIEYHNVHYGINKHYDFFNKMMFNEFLLVLNDCEKAQGFEIAEIQFERNTVSGFCNTQDLTLSRFQSLKEDFSSYVPSNTWYKVDCSELYTGSIQHFCSSGNWTKTVNQCHCKAPLFFKYPSSVVYISLRQFISIVPKWKGAELHFFTHDILPSGLSLNDTTGAIQGEIRDPISMMTLHIVCGNMEGYLETELSIVTVNNHEVLLIIIAAIMLIVFFIMIWLITSSMKKKRVESEDANISVLHVDGLSKELRSFLL